jgi:hypothetical protein
MVAEPPGRPGDYRDAHPSSPALVIEVAEASLGFDRRRKGSPYAWAGLPGYGATAATAATSANM